MRNPCSMPGADAAGELRTAGVGDGAVDGAREGHGVLRDQEAAAAGSPETIAIAGAQPNEHVRQSAPYIAAAAKA